MIDWFVVVLVAAMLAGLVLVAYTFATACNV